ncbi:MAG: flagellar basal body rod protein FlgB [Gammaproteobacteria bacterium]|nr:flagellar basal body rod protein FlgB [Gammaproteobacteria bacterium]
MSTIHDRIFSNHDEALVLRAQRASVLASNLANADTPNYKARDIEFQDVLKSAAGYAAQDLPLMQTRAGHLPAVQALLPSVRHLYRIPTHPALDGNTVDAQQEQVRFAENAVQYQATLTFLNGRISGLMGALKGE